MSAFRERRNQRPQTPYHLRTPTTMSKTPKLISLPSTDKTNSLDEQREDIIKLVTPSSAKEEKLRHLIDARHQLEARLAQATRAVENLSMIEASQASKDSSMDSKVQTRHAVANASRPSSNPREIAMKTSVLCSTRLPAAETRAAKAPAYMPQRRNAICMGNASSGLVTFSDIENLQKDNSTMIHDAEMARDKKESSIAASTVCSGNSHTKARKSQYGRPSSFTPATYVPSGSMHGQAKSLHHGDSSNSVYGNSSVRSSILLKAGPDDLSELYRASDSTKRTLNPAPIEITRSKMLSNLTQSWKLGSTYYVDNTSPDKTDDFHTGIIKDNCMPAQTFLAASDFTFEPTTPKGYSSNKVDESRQDSKHNSPVSKLKLKRSQPTDIMADFLRDQDAAREGFYVVGKAEIERDGGFERVEVECMSATNGKGDLSFWEDEEDEEQWFEGWDEGGLAKSIPKVGICGQKGREVRFRSEL